jgi:hypothetical protein
MRTSLRLCESATAESNARARPSQFRKLPLFSVIAATGRTTSATAVTELEAISSETTNLSSVLQLLRDHVEDREHQRHRLRLHQDLLQQGQR